MAVSDPDLTILSAPELDRMIGEYDRLDSKIAQHDRVAVWLYFHFTTSLRDVEELLAERGVGLNCETVAAGDAPLWSGVQNCPLSSWV